MDMGTVPHLHTVTIRVNPSHTHPTSTKATMPLFPLRVSHTPVSHPIALQIDTNPVTPFPPSPKKAPHKWQMGQGRCQGHQCPVLLEGPRSVHTHLRRFKVNWDIIPLGAASVNILHRLSQDRFRSRSLKLSSSSIHSNIGRWESRRKCRCRGRVLTIAGNDRQNLPPSFGVYVTLYDM